MNRNNEKTMDLPIHYYSFTTVPREYTPRPDLPEDASPDIGEFLSAMASAKSEVSSLTPYLFVLLETEDSRPFWQYMDMAGELGRIRFSSTASYANVTKIIYPSGAYTYRINQVFLRRK